MATAPSYETEKEVAVAEVVAAYVDGAPDVRGGLGNVLLNLSRHIDSAIAKHLAEGIVITPENERTDPEIGYLQLKLVSNRYLER